MDRDKEIKNKFEAFQVKLKKTALGINFIQPEWKKYFIDLAKEEYSNDYGVTLKELCKLHKGYFPKGNEEVEAKLDLLSNEVTEIKNKLDEHLKIPEEESNTPEGYHRSADGSKKIKDS